MILVQINVGEEQVSSLMIGSIGIKSVSIGESVIYTRPGGFFYLELNTKENE